jgi:hypothetical protein
MREYHVRICERLGVKFPGPTRAYSAERAVPTSCSVRPHFEVQRQSAARAPNWACRVKLVRAQVAVIAPSLRERQRA